MATIATLPVDWSVFALREPRAGIVLDDPRDADGDRASSRARTGLRSHAPALFTARAVIAPGKLALHTAFDHFPGTPLVLPVRPLWAIASASGLAIAGVRGNGRAGRLAALALGLLIAPLPIGGPSASRSSRCT